MVTLLLLAFRWVVVVAAIRYGTPLVV